MATYSKNPIELSTSKVLATHQDDILPILDTYGVAVIALNTIDKTSLSKAIETTNFYNTANAMFKDEFKVEEPNMEEKLNPAKYKKRKAGDDAQGMLHQYGTPIHTLIQNDKTLRETMTSLYGDSIKYLPNRLRKCTKFKNDGKTLHIEAHELFKVNSEGEIELIPGEIATIIGLTGIRRFGFWDMKDADLKPIKDYHDKNGSEFTLIDPDYMHQHYPSRRRMINIDCTKTPHLIMWRESNPHEIAHSPSLSIFISPVREFNNTKITKVTSYQPLEYIGLTYHESDMLGLCYNMGGYEWPSGKKLYQFCHHRAYNHFINKVNPYYMNSKGKFQQRLINTGKVNQHTGEYQAKLKEMNIVLPKIAFHKDTPNFVVDITKLPINILKDYGFITSESLKESLSETLIESDEMIVVEALLSLDRKNLVNNTIKIDTKTKNIKNTKNTKNIKKQNKIKSAGHLH